MNISDGHEYTEAVGLERLDGARRALAAVASASDAWELAKTADMARQYARMQNLGAEASNYALAIKAKASILMANFVDEGQAEGTIAVQGQHHVEGAHMSLPQVLGTDSQQARDAVREARRIRDSLEGADIDSIVSEANAEGRDLSMAGLLQAATTHVRGTFGTGENEWYTPPEYLTLARHVLGGFDLDPASSPEAQVSVRADRFFTKEDDGLQQEWFGHVWLNPPYAQPHISDFVNKLCTEVESGRVGAAILLTHNYTDTAWFQQAARHATAICFTRGRVKFYSPDGSVAAPTQGQAFFYFGNEPWRFSQEFQSVGFVVTPASAEVLAG